MEKVLVKWLDWGPFNFRHAKHTRYCPCAWAAARTTALKPGLDPAMNDIFVSFPFEERFDAVFKTIRDVAARRHLNARRIDQSSLIAESQLLRPY